jgi:hypothetical protein
VWLLGFILAGGLWFLLLREQINLLFAVVVGGALLLVALRDRSLGVVLTLGYLTIMGDIRRIAASAYGQPKLDLLLLAGPFVAVVLSVPLFLHLRLKDMLSKAMLGLLIVMMLEMFNPQQGGVAIGVTGALFYIVPVFWFWIGRQLGSPRMVERLLYTCVFPLGVAAAVMGLCQTFIGFLPYQQQWINAVATSYTALHLGGTIRAFGFSVSGAEYATLLTFGAVGTAAAYFSPKRMWVIATPLFLTAVVIASSRGVLLKVVFTLSFVWTLRKGRKLDTSALIRLGVLTALALAGIFGLASHFASTDSSSLGKGTAVQNALEHQAVGLAHPLSERYSTAGIHGKLLSDAFLQGIVDPLGHGLGATTAAFRKFGGASSQGSEVDFGDMFISLGIVGGLLYVFIIISSLYYALRYAQNAPKSVGLPIFAILVSSLGVWLISGMYSTTSLLFFLLGCLVYDRNHLVHEVSRASITGELMPIGL